MRASELPYDVKQRILRQIGNQLGSETYRKVVGSLGEDGLIDSIVAKQEEARPRRRIRWDLVGSMLWGLFFLYVWGMSSLIGQQGWGTQWWHYLLPLPAGLFLFLSWCLIEWLWNFLFGSR